MWAIISHRSCSRCIWNVFGHKCVTKNRTLETHEVSRNDQNYIFREFEYCLTVEQTAELSHTKEWVGFRMNNSLLELQTG